MRGKGKRKRKPGKSIMAIVMISVVVLVVHGATAWSGNRTAEWPRVQDLGDKYLDELDYEEAMTFFEEVLKNDKRAAEELWDAVESGLSLESRMEIPGDLPSYDEAVQKGGLKELLDQALGLMPEEFQVEIKRRFDEWMEENGA